MIDVEIDITHNGQRKRVKAWVDVWTNEGGEPLAVVEKRADIVGPWSDGHVFLTDAQKQEVRRRLPDRLREVHAGTYDDHHYYDDSDQT